MALSPGFRSRVACVLAAVGGSLLATASPVFADNIPAGTAAAYYDPSNGHVFFEANGVAIWSLNSAAGQFTGQPTDLNPSPTGVRWTINGTSRQADASTIGEFIGSNSITFNNVFNTGTFEFDYAGTPGDLGQLLPVGLVPALPTSSLAEAIVTLTYNTLGGQAVTLPVVVPEPTCAGMLALAAASFAARRRRC